MAIQITNGWIYPPTKYTNEWRLRLNDKTYTFKTESELKQFLQGVRK